MLHVDGSLHSGSGTIVRFAVALAALRGTPLRVSRARARRAKPGLRPQHLAAVRACADLCGAETEGLAVGSDEFLFAPGGRIRGGRYAWDIGTAGSATMLALGILPVACFADAPVEARITGGVFQDFAPSPHHLAHVLAPLVGRMGARARIEVARPGYVPGGAGCLELRVEPAGRLAPLALDDPGDVRSVAGIALASHLAERRVAERMARSCEAALGAAGLVARIERIDDASAAQPGASLAVWTETTTGCLLGADRAGAPGRSSESIGRFVARALCDDLATGASVDLHAADQLVLFAALADGASRWRTPRETEHLATNLWLAELFGATAQVEGQRVEVRGLGLDRSG
jgi:RNA 3'-terminal phosphate cyclase (ATP)